MRENIRKQEQSVSLDGSDDSNISVSDQSDDHVFPRSKKIVVKWKAKKVKWVKMQVF